MKSKQDEVRKKAGMSEGQIIEDMGEKEHERETMRQISAMSYKDEADYKAKSKASADAGDIARRRAKNKAALKRSEQGAARRREARNELRRQGKYKGPMEGV